MKTSLRVLVALGAIAQFLMIYGSSYELNATFRGELYGDISASDLLLFLLPALLGFGGATAAGWLHRRGSAWAWVVAWVPLVLLGLALSLTVLLWFNPITHQR